MRRFSSLSVVMLASLLALTGCSGEPSEADMKISLEAVMKSNPIMASLFSGFDEFEKLGCKEAEGKPGYVCDYRATTTVMGQKNTSNASARFVEGDSGWQAQQN